MKKLIQNSFFSPEFESINTQLQKNQEWNSSVKMKHFLRELILATNKRQPPNPLQFITISSKNSQQQQTYIKERLDAIIQTP